MERLDHGFKFLDLLPVNATGTVAAVGGKVTQGVIAPIVMEARTDQVPRCRIEMVHGEQLDRRDAQIG